MKRTPIETTLRRWIACGLLLATTVAHAGPKHNQLIDQLSGLSPEKAMQKVLPMARKDWEGVIGTLVRESRGNDENAKATNRLLKIIFARTELADGAPHYGVQWGFYLSEDKDGTLTARPYVERLYDGPAKKAGLRRGETAVEIDGISLNRPDAPNFLRRYLRISKPGSSVELTLSASSIGKNPGELATAKNANTRKLRLPLGPARKKPERGERPGEFEAWKAAHLVPHVLTP